MPFATADDLTHIPNGKFTVRGHHFWIYTVQSGPLTGQRIIKRKLNSYYKGFATLETDGTLYLWSRFYRDRYTSYFVDAQHLVEKFNSRPFRVTIDDWLCESRASRALILCLRCNGGTGPNYTLWCPRHVPTIPVDPLLIFRTDEEPNLLSNLFSSYSRSRRSPSVRFYEGDCAAHHESPQPAIINPMRTIPLPMCEIGTGHVQ